MVRITQLGSGNALLVEDSANPDSTPFVIGNTGLVGIGTASGTSRLNVYHNSSTTPALTVTQVGTDLALYASGSSQITGYITVGSGIYNERNGSNGISYTSSSNRWELNSGASDTILTVKSHSYSFDKSSAFLSGYQEESIYSKWPNIDIDYLYLYPIDTSEIANYSSLFLTVSVAGIGYTDAGGSGIATARFAGQVSNGFIKSPTTGLWTAGTVSNTSHTNVGFTTVPTLLVSPNGYPSLRLAKTNSNSNHYSQYIVKMSSLYNS
jgi:hypothetical protein